MYTGHHQKSLKISTYRFYAFCRQATSQERYIDPEWVLLVPGLKEPRRGLMLALELKEPRPGSLIHLWEFSLSLN